MRDTIQQDQSVGDQDQVLDQEVDPADVPDDQSGTNSPCEALELIEQVNIGDQSWTLDSARCFERRYSPSEIDATMTAIAVDITGGGFVRALRDVESRQGIVQAWSGSSLGDLRVNDSIRVGDSGESDAQSPRYVDGIMVARTSAGALVVAASGLDPNCAMTPATANGALAWIDIVDNAASLNGQLTLDPDTAVTVATGDECGEIPGELGFMVDDVAEPNAELLIYREYPRDSGAGSIGSLDITRAENSYRSLNSTVPSSTSMRLSRARSDIAIANTGSGRVFAFQRRADVFTGPLELSSDGSIAALADRSEGMHPDLIATGDGGALSVSEISCEGNPLSCQPGQPKQLIEPGGSVIQELAVTQLGDESAAIVYVTSDGQPLESEVWLTFTDLTDHPPPFQLMTGAQADSHLLFSGEGSVTALDMDSKVDAERTTFAISAIIASPLGPIEQLMFFRMARQQ